MNLYKVRVSVSLNIRVFIRFNETQDNSGPPHIHHHMHYSIPHPPPHVHLSIGVSLIEEIEQKTIFVDKFYVLLVSVTSRTSQSATQLADTIESIC